MRTCSKTVKYVKSGIFYAACLGLIWTGTIGTDGAAYAQTGRQIGKTQIDAGISAKGEFNDNIYWTDKNETDDFIFTVTPDIDLVWENSPGNFLRLGYTVDLASYMDDSDNNYARHNPYLGFGVKNPAGLYFRMDLSYINTEDPYGTENEYALGLSTKRWNNMVTAMAGFNFAQRYGVEARYVNFLERWDETFDKWQNRDENTFSLGLFYQATAKTRLFCQYEHQNTEFGDQNDGAAARVGPAWSSATSQDHRQNNLFFGARFSPVSKISGEAKLGYGNTRYDNDLSRTGVKYEDEDTWVAQTLLNYQVRTRTRLGLLLSRSYRVTAHEAADAPGYFDTRAGISLDQIMMHRLSANLGFEWGAYDYQKPGVEKYFNLYTWNAGLGYDINKWLDAGLYYRYKTKIATKSVYENDEYSVNLLYMMVTARY